MTRTHPSFPIAFRLLAVTLALAAVVVVSSVAGAAPSKQDVEHANAKVDALLAEVGDARDRAGRRSMRASPRRPRRWTPPRVGSRRSRRNSWTPVPASTEARARYDEITGRLNDRAAQAFMNGPASNVEFLLGSSSLSELSDRLEFVDVVAAE